MSESIARNIVQKLVDAGYKAYYAGGYVRDKLLGHPSADVDIATSAPPEIVMKLFAKTIPVGVSFGSVIVVEEDHPFEVTTFRKEGPYLDGRHPSSVELSTAQEDAKRRSFTINGMFYDPLTDTVYDFVGGREDLKAGIIRAIGNPAERFEEDKLRMIRAVRFATRFHFQIEEQTAQAICETAKHLFPSVAIERVWQEFTKMSGPEFLVELHRFGLLEQIFPELKGVSIEERLANYQPEAPTIGNVMLLFPNGNLEICDRLKVSKKEKQFVQLMQSGRRLLEGGEPVEWAHFFAHDEAVICLRLLGEDDHAQHRQALASYIDRIRRQTPIVAAEDLKKAGIPPGPEMGRLLKEAERISVNEKIESKEILLKRLL